MISINMVMPVSCNGCRFANDWNECVATNLYYDEHIDTDVQWYCISNTKPLWCPLEIVQDGTKQHLSLIRDIVTCGECKYRWKRGTITTDNEPQDIYGCKIVKGVLTSNNDFCSKGERSQKDLLNTPSKNSIKDLADTKPHNKGQWLISSNGYYPYCSKCKREPENGKMTDFCPHCGADMRGESHGDKENNTQE